MFTQTPQVAVAAAAGVASFLSPCMLPVIPAFLARIGGVSAGESVHRRRMVTHAALFVLGFSLVFATLGVVLQSVLADVAATVEVWLARAAGVVVIVFGLHLSGLVEITAFHRGESLPGADRDPGVVGSLVLGGAFAVTWTPCVGPILGSAFALAASQPVSAFPIMLSYSLGLGVPFLLVALVPERASTALTGSGRRAARIQQAFGVLLLVLGVLLFTQQLALVGNAAYTLEVLS